MMEPKEKIRTAYLRPYKPGMGCPSFAVEIWDTYTYDSRGCTNLVARLRTKEDCARRYHHVLDCRYANGPGTADDSDRSMRMAVEAVAMKPGDTDPDFFADHTQDQLDIATEHGDALNMEADYRFGENG